VTGVKLVVWFTLRLVEAIACVAFGLATAAVPVSEMVCVALVAFRLLSVRTSEPLTVPLVVPVGAKLMGRVQLAPDASVADDELPVVSNGQAEPPLLFNVK
jgi:hypothetical protein